MLPATECEIVASPAALKLLPQAQLQNQSEIIRQYLIHQIAKTGGHIGANLSVVELSVALHYVFDSPNDKIIFDTGHQGYTHKLLTGRQPQFDTLNTYRGMSRFISRSESAHDIIDASHAGTSIALACGYARGLHASGSANFVVAVIGDGSMVEGMAFEALNYGVVQNKLKLIIVINDNEMAIAESVGGVRNLTTGANWQQKSGGFFTGLGYEYIAIADGHNVVDVVQGLQTACTYHKPTIVHVKTQKGKGLSCADTHPYKMHFSMPFDHQTGQGASPTVAGRTYAVVAAEQLMAEMEQDDSIYAITPATPYASSLDALLSRFPDRVLDVGMAEQHAVGMASGLALAGKKPVVCMQTTFMQRAFDQLLHDVCYMNLPVTVLGVRAGFAGYDGATHHGIYDIPYLRSFPNMQLVYPVNTQACQEILQKRLANPVGPMVILYPYEPITLPEPISGTVEASGLALAHQGKDGLITCLGNTLTAAWQLQQRLQDIGKHFGIVCIQSIKPFPEQRFGELLESGMDVVTLEESILAGGVGSLVLEVMSAQQKMHRVLRMGINDSFIHPGSKQECSTEAGMNIEQVLASMLDKWPDYQSDLHEKA